MENSKVIIDIMSILVAILSVVLPIIIFNFKKQNEVIKVRKRWADYVEVYGFYLFIPLISFIFQVITKDLDGLQKQIRNFISFLLIGEAIILLGYKIWKDYKHDNFRTRGVNKKLNVTSLIVNIIIWIFYSAHMILISYMMYKGIRATNREQGGAYMGGFLGLYVVLSLVYFLVGWLLIGIYKRIYARNVIINYCIDGKDIEKVVDFNDFDAKTEYASFYIKDDREKHLIPWDKINNVKIRYK